MTESKKLPGVKAGCGCGCGGAEPTAEKPAIREEEVRSMVRERYGAVAEGKAGAAGCCCGPVAPAETMLRLGYSAEQAAALPEGANLGLGCGNPIAHAALQPGEVVLDLGSGAGIDCFLAAREVGPSGKVIGVDMTASMVERARANAAQAGASQVEFRLGEIEHLPLGDGTVDVIISNCVINLSPDKRQVFREARRVLKPGGRLLVSDLVLLRPIAESLRRNVALYVGCIAGASLRQEYLDLISRAGFSEIEVVQENGYEIGAEAYPEGSPEREAYAAVVSLKVRARKA
jgi:arsenite methyltransferase